MRQLTTLLHRAFCLVFVFSLIAIAIGIPPNAAAEQPARPDSTLRNQGAVYDGVNVLFIVDQSGSMGGGRYGSDFFPGDGNDPLDLRFYGVEFALDWLSGYVAATPANQRPEVNFAVVNFGTYPRPIQGWVNIDRDFNQLSTTEQDRIREGLSKERYHDQATNSYTNLGFTDFIEAYTEAKSVMDHAPQPTSGKPYLTVVILLTDGDPCLPGDEYLYCSDLYARNHLTELATQVHRDFPNAEAYVVGIDASDDFWPESEPYWIDVVCPVSSNCDPIKHKQVHTETDIGAHFNEIFDDVASNLIGAGTSSFSLIPPQTFFVDPYTQLLRLNVYKSVVTPLGANAVLLTTLDGTAPALSAKKLDSPIEVYHITLPQPGYWQFDMDQAALASVERVKYSAELIQAVGEMQINSTPADAAGTLLVEQYVPVNVRLEIIDGNRVTLPRYSGDAFPLTVTAHVYDDKQTEVASFDMPYDASLPGTSTFAAQWIPDQPGTYEVRVDASYQHPDEGTKYLLQNDSVFNGFRVAEVSFTMASLPSTSELQSTPIRLTTTVHNKANKQQVSWVPVEFKTRVRIIDGSGTVVNESVLNNTSQDPGTITADFQLDQPGQYQVETDVGLLDENGMFNSVVPFPQASLLEIRPEQSISLKIYLDPGEESVVAQDLGFTDSWPFLWSTTPATVRVLVMNNHTNTPVRLSDVTGKDKDKPRLTKRHNGEEEDLTHLLRDYDNGEYSVELTDLGEGDFEFVASVDNSRVTGDFKWSAYTVSAGQERTRASFFLYGGIGLAVFLVTMFGGGYVARRIHRMRTEHPVTGSLMILVHDYGGGAPVPMRTIPLSRYKRNKITLSGTDASPFKRIVLHTPKNPEEYKKGIIYLEGLKLGDQTKYSKDKPLKLRPGEMPNVWTGNNEQYFMIKDPEDMPGMAGPREMEEDTTLFG